MRTVFGPSPNADAWPHAIWAPPEPSPSAINSAIAVDIMQSVPHVLIRDVPDDDLEQIRSAAADRGQSLQAYLREALSVQAAQLRRQAAVGRIAARLRGRPPVSEADRRAVADAVDASLDERTGDLGDPARRDR